MRIKVNVTQEDINRGEICSDTYCPVAKAVNRAVNHLARSTVYYSKILLMSSTGIVGFKTSKKVKLFIETFDDTSTGQPFSFTLNLRKSHAETLGIPYAK